MFETLTVSLNAALYTVDTGLDLRVIKKLCCHHADEAWTMIVNPYLCGTSFSIWLTSSVICNGVALKQLMAEFKNPFLRLLFVLLGVIQVLPYIWFLYCICALLCCSNSRSKPLDNLIKGTVKMKMYEALFEGAGQMCMQMFLVMEQEQAKLGVGSVSFAECRTFNSSAIKSPATSSPVTSSPISNTPSTRLDTVVNALEVVSNEALTTMVDSWFYLSIFFSLMSVCLTIIKGVAQRLDKGSCWKIGYALMTILAIGSRVYLKSTLGTYWDPTKWGHFNLWWLTPIIACNIASMIYACTLPRESCAETLKRGLAGTCNFLSKDGLPTSVSYFVCSVVFAGYYWSNIHLNIALFLNMVVLVVNLTTAICCVKEPIFHGMIYGII